MPSRPIDLHASRFGVARFHKTASAWCTEATTIAPSPTAEATRLIDPDRTSPTAKTPAQLVASGCDNAWEDAGSSETADVPVRTNPLSSKATARLSHSVNDVGGCNRWRGRVGAVGRRARSLLQRQRQRHEAFAGELAKRQPVRLSQRCVSGGATASESPRSSGGARAGHRSSRSRPDARRRGPPGARARRVDALIAAQDCACVRGGRSLRRRRVRTARRRTARVR